MATIAPDRRAETITKEIRKAMIDCDLTFDQLGGDVQGPGWRARIKHPERMTLGALMYLSDRLGIDWPRLISR